MDRWFAARDQSFAAGDDKFARGGGKSKSVPPASAGGLKNQLNSLARPSADADGADSVALAGVKAKRQTQPALSNNLKIGCTIDRS
jgi:hypothetical protein